MAASSSQTSSCLGMEMQDSVSEHFLRGCKSGNLASVQRNADQSELSHTKDRRGNTGLILAADTGQELIVSYLINLDDDPLHINASNDAGRTALMVAVDRGRRKIVEILLDHPSTIRSLKDRWGISAIDIANMRQDRRIVQLLGGTLAPSLLTQAPPPRPAAIASREGNTTSVGGAARATTRPMRRLPSHASVDVVTPVETYSMRPSTLELTGSEARRLTRSTSMENVRTRPFSVETSAANTLSAQQNSIEENILSALNIDEEIFGDIKKQITGQINEYQEKIAIEKSESSRKEFEAKKKTETMELFCDNNNLRKDLKKTQIKDREEFEKKQLEELKLFQREAKIRQDQLELEMDVREQEVVASEKRVKNYQDIVQVLTARMDHLAQDPLALQANAAKTDSSTAKHELECPICLEDMAPPKKIFQCCQGHAVCGECFGRPQVKKCPTCRGQLIGRATILEKVARSFFEQE